MSSKEAKGKDISFEENEDEFFQEKGDRSLEEKEELYKEMDNSYFLKKSKELKIYSKVFSEEVTHNQCVFGKTEISKKDTNSPKTVSTNTLLPYSELIKRLRPIMYGLLISDFSEIEIVSESLQDSQKLSADQGYTNSWITKTPLIDEIYDEIYTKKFVSSTKRPYLIFTDLKNENDVENQWDLNFLKNFHHKSVDPENCPKFILMEGNYLKNFNAQQISLPRDLSSRVTYTEKLKLKVVDKKTIDIVYVHEKFKLCDLRYIIPEHYPDLLVINQIEVLYQKFE